MQMEKPLIDEVDDLIGSLGDPIQPTPDRFPIEAFPDRFRQIVERMISLNPNLPPNYLLASMFSAGASAIGGNIRAAEGKEKLIFWTMFVGYPGDGKTACLSLAFGPFTQIATEHREKYNRDIKEYEAIEPTSGKKPFLRLPYHTKPTIESLADELEYNRKGTILLSEELSAWIENFTRNGKGSDEGWYNTSWDGKPLSESTRHGRKFFCADPCLNILGGIQYGVLEAIMNKTRLSNGFFERCLFVTNDQPLLPRQAISEDQAELEAEYQDLIINLYRDSDDDDGTDQLTTEGDITLSQEATEYWTAWCEKNCEIRNRLKAEGEFILMGVAAKWEKYLIRFALAIVGLRSYVNHKKRPTEIDLESLEIADQIYKFYYKNTETIVKMIERPSHLRGSAEWQVKIYSELPEGEFSFGDATEIARPIFREIDPKLSEDALKQRIKRYLLKESLFNHISRDKYKKRY